MERQPVKVEKVDNGVLRWFKCESCGKTSEDWIDTKTSNCFANTGLCHRCYYDSLKPIQGFTLIAEKDMIKVPYRTVGKEKEENIMDKMIKGISKVLNPKKQGKTAREDKCVVIGHMGEVGSALKKMIEGADYWCAGFDLSCSEKIANDTEVKFMHITIPYINQKQFTSAVLGYAKEIKPEIMIIHSTVIPGTTRHIRKQMEKWAGRPQLAYSPCRGQHTKLMEDFKRYDKWVASEQKCRESVEFHLKHLGMRAIGFSDRQWEHLEVSKLIDTSQYGILITYAQVANRLASKYNVPYSMVRDFMSQTNELYNNRPDITPGYVGGKCVRQNIDLLKRIMPHELWRVFEQSNRQRAKELGLSPDEMKE